MREIIAGSTDQSTEIRLLLPSGLPRTDAQFDTAGLHVYYLRQGETPVEIDLVALGAIDSAHTDGGFIHVGAGIYRVDLPDAAAIAGTDELLVFGVTATGVVIPAKHPIVVFSVEDLGNDPNSLIGINQAGTAYELKTINVGDGLSLEHDGTDVNLGVTSFVNYSSGSLYRRLRDSTSVEGLYLRRPDSTSIRLGMLINGSQAAEFRFALDPDDMLLWRGGYVNSRSAVANYPVRPNYVTLVNITEEGTDDEDSYTETVDGSFAFSFVGTGLIISNHRDDTGGLWEVTIDEGTADELVVTYSVYNATPDDEDTTVASGLAFGLHTVIARFKGDDPNNAPNGGTSKGWFKWKSNDQDTVTTATVEVDDKSQMSDTSPAIVVTTNSVADFAISARPEPAGGIAADWVPSHAGATGACRDVVRTISIDGYDLGDDILDLMEDAYWECTKSIRISQTYVAYSTDDTDGDFPLWSGHLVHLFDADGLTITHSIVTEQDTFVAAGYLAMLPGHMTHVDEARFNNDESYSVASQASDTDTDISNICDGAAFLNAATGNSVAAGIESLTDVLGLREKSIVASMLFLQERTDTTTKVYWRRFLNEILPDESHYRSQVRYFITKGLLP